MAGQNKKKTSKNAKSAKPTSPPKKKSQDAGEPIVGPRIIGGQLRGRKLEYSGDLRTRPMKDRLREAIFNLIGPSIRGKHALDLFAGTGALALEALSRGAGQATLIEQHHPTAEIIRRNLVTLGLENLAVVIPGNTFVWWKMQAKRGPMSIERPWAVFCSPPYEFFVSRVDEMLELVSGVMLAAPAESVVVVEADERFDFQKLPEPEAWDVRTYPPAVVGIYRKD